MLTPKRDDDGNESNDGIGVIDTQNTETMTISDVDSVESPDSAPECADSPDYSKVGVVLASQLNQLKNSMTSLVGGLSSKRVSHQQVGTYISGQLVPRDK